MKALLTAPGFLSPYGSLGADVSSILAWVFTLLYMYGWYMGAKHRGQGHHIVSLFATGAMISYFTAYYLARSLGALALEGKEGFGGPDWIYLYVFSPLLTVHILVVGIGLVLAVYMVILGFRSSRRKADGRYLENETLRMGEKGFRAVLFGSALVFGLGAIIRRGSIARLLVYVVGFLMVAAVLFIERGVERWIPDAASRHRKIGKFTMSLYLLALLTSTSTYFMLYFIYPTRPR